MRSAAAFTLLLALCACPRAEEPEWVKRFPAPKETVKSAFPTAETGAFRLTVKETQASRKLDEAASTAAILTELAWDKPFLVVRASASKVDCRIGGKVVETRNAVSLPGPVAAIPPQVTIRTGSIPDARSIDSLAVDLKLAVSKGPVLFTFEDLAKADQKTAEGIEVTRGAIKKDGKYWSVLLGHAYDAKANAVFESFEVGRFRYHTVELIAPDGTSFKPAGLEVGDTQLVFRFEEGKNGLKVDDIKDWKLKYTLPAGWEEITARFAFEKLPLP